MAVPDYQTLMRPLLLLSEQMGEQTIRRLRDQLADQLQLTDAERSEMLPSGNQDRFTNRVQWAASYLARAGLLHRPSRGRVEITERGRESLRDGPERITARWLKPFIDDRERTAGNGKITVGVAGSEDDHSPDDGATPEEDLEESYQQLRAILANELLDRIKQNPPDFFERLVVDLLVAMGYGGSLTDAGQAVGKSGDDGIDGIIKEDKLGLDVIYLQAKRWDNVIGRPAVQGFAGSLEGHRARKGVFITTASFTKEARSYVNRIEKRIVLIDGQELAQLMIDHDVGVATAATYEVKRVDDDYFEG